MQSMVGIIGHVWCCHPGLENIKVDEIMRQRRDSAFSELLCRVRTDDFTSEDIDIFKSRVTTPDMPNYPNHALHVYRLNTDVDQRNKLMLNQ